MTSSSIAPSRVTRWQAYDARRRVPGPVHVRHDRPGGEKDVQWRSDGAWGLRGHELADLIYADRIPMPAHVVITEGERACDAVRAAGLAAVATVSGAGAREVWSEAVVDLFLGVEVTIWPDADVVGRDHMGRVATLLEPVVGSMRLVDIPPAVPAGWDAADAARSQVLALIATAHDVWLRR